MDAVALAARGDETLLIQRRARAWIDLNRSEQDRDPRIDDGASAQTFPQASENLRSGLGLVPRRVTRAGDLWKRRFSAEEIGARIAADYRPYHDALAAALAAARGRFGVAVLLDLHSMPTIAGDDPPRIVIGDRFGRSAGPRFVARVEGEIGCRHALNSPYAGGHILNRHGDPAAGIHAIQLEIDRSLYLDAALDAPGPGLPATAALVARIAAALADEALRPPLAIAAE